MNYSNKTLFIPSQYLPLNSVAQSLRRWKKRISLGYELPQCSSK